mmetsp:Transcript_59396/g.191995  ORF Transcript_59396/g.191995 Transcript_59396/m.191995 type:complete len:281 (+) Transcript_59396:64-906(+)
MQYSNSNPRPAPTAAEKAAMLQKLQAALDRFEITIAEANDLVVLSDYEIVVVADDSGSMVGPSQPPHLRTIGEQKHTRWEELKATVAEMVEIATCFHDRGIDIFFLNREPLLQVKHATDSAFVQAFEENPAGKTPLTETLRRVCQNAGQHHDERKMLLFVLTDGEPNGGAEPCMKALRELTSTGHVKIQIMAVTPEEEEIEWLNHMDRELKTVDVTDDYYAEKQQVLKSGIVTTFTRGDWVMKAMLGPVSHKFDAWDERRGKNQEVERLVKNACDSCPIC